MENSKPQSAFLISNIYIHVYIYIYIKEKKHSYQNILLKHRVFENLRQIMKKQYQNISEKKYHFEPTFIRIYAAITDPAIVANPPVQTACNSDFVISLRNGRISKGASLCKKINLEGSWLSTIYMQINFVKRI